MYLPAPTLSVFIAVLNSTPFHSLSNHFCSSDSQIPPMGGCFSKKKASSSHHNPQPQPVPLSSAVTPLAPETTLKAVTVPKIHQVIEEEQQFGGKASKEESLVKKEIFVIKHRKSHDRDKHSPPPPTPPQTAENIEPAVSSASTEGGVCNVNTTAAVRTSSCTKEEVDAILIQCGRLSRSNSSGKTPSSRKYSGSKRSYDFDCDNDNDIGSAAASTDNGLRKKGNDEDDDRPRRRPSSRSSSHGRRRTPSRERDQQQQRSGSRERGSGIGSSGGGRRVSRSPGRRTENSEGPAVGSNAANGTNRPGKMVSVPATVSSLAMDKSINGVEAATNTGNGIKRISVKRNVGESPARTAASPRSQSPARTNPNANNAKACNNNNNENQIQPTLSRSSSRKAEHSPYRRNPLSEIDPNSLAYPHSAANKGQGGIKKSNVETNHKAKAATNVNGTAMVEPKVGADNVKPQQLTRSRSSRRSRDLDLNPEALLNPIPSSYTTLLLEDIQNFHQNNNTPPPPFSLPACVSKACSIMEAVADLNSTTSSNLSDRKGIIPPTDDSNKNHFVETEVIGSDHLMEPSFHKYVTVRRGGGGGGDMDEQESSGSNSIVGSGGGGHWGLSSSSWEPNSADSTDRWSSRTKSDYNNTPLGVQKQSSNDMKR